MQGIYYIVLIKHLLTTWCVLAFCYITLWVSKFPVFSKSGFDIHLCYWSSCGNINKLSSFTLIHKTSGIVDAYFVWYLKTCTHPMSSDWFFDDHRVWRLHLLKIYKIWGNISTNSPHHNSKNWWECCLEKRDFEMKSLRWDLYLRLSVISTRRFVLKIVLPEDC